jgi:di/tricarboxylate transporter
MEMLIVAAVLLLALVLYVTEWIPVDLTSVGIIAALSITGVLTPAEATAGFANPAVITVGAMFLLSKGMIRTGAVGFIGQIVLRLSGGSPVRAMLVILAIAALASAFINNTPVVVLLVPIVLGFGCEIGLSPSKLLIPVSYASILAGTCTLIGTSTNIIVSDMSAVYGFGDLGMFELSKLGVPIAVVGLVFLVFFAPKFMPEMESAVCEIRDKDNRKYLAELLVPRGSSYVGADGLGSLQSRYPSITVLELIRYSHVYYPGRDPVTIAPDDILLVKGSANDLVDILNKNEVELTQAEQGLKFDATPNNALIVELIVPPQSRLRGERLSKSRLSRDLNLDIIAIQRSGLHYTEQKLQDIQLKIGDILLVRCPESQLERLREQPDFIVVDDVHHGIEFKHLAKRAFVIFGAMVVAASIGLANIMVCALAAVFLMFATGCLSLRDGYRSLQGNVLLIIVGMFALSTALEKTGATALFARWFLDLFADVGPAPVLAGIIVLTSLCTHLLSNNATAILLVPLAVTAAHGLGVDPKPFIIAVCFGASACFATPIGYQTNLLVYSPGGYRFTDYLKLGIPLNMIVMVMGSVFIPMIWPF